MGRKKKYEETWAKRWYTSPRPNLYVRANTEATVGSRVGSRHPDAGPPLTEDLAARCIEYLPDPHVRRKPDLDAGSGFGHSSLAGFCVVNIHKPFRDSRYVIPRDLAASELMVPPSLYDDLDEGEE